jgi:hypothetical protein
MVKARVFHVADSPPAPAWRTVKPVTLCVAARSTCRKRGLAAVQNLSLLPPLTVPLTALDGASFVLHAALPLAALFRAMLPPELELDDDEELDEDDELEDELLEEDEEDDELELEEEDDDEEELLEVPSHTPRLVYQPQLGQ